MGLSLLFAAAALTPAAEQVMVYGHDANPTDVAYEELAAGRNQEAAERIRATRLDRQGDPAALINLGTALARMGDRQSAIDCYQTAILSQERYDLELADGRWMDSRAAARLAITSLARGTTLAVR